MKEESSEHSTTKNTTQWYCSARGESVNGIMCLQSRMNARNSRTSQWCLCMSRWVGDGGYGAGRYRAHFRGSNWYRHLLMMVYYVQFRYGWLWRTPSRLSLSLALSLRLSHAGVVEPDFHISGFVMLLLAL